jgi:histidine ammonia-lyase
MMAHVTAVGAGERVQDAELPGQRRHHPDLGRQGGPRQHGPDRGAQAARRGRQPGARAGDRGDRAARAIDLRGVASSPALHARARGHPRPRGAVHRDRSMSADIERLADAIVAGELRTAADLPHEL